MDIKTLLMYLALFFLLTLGDPVCAFEPISKQASTLDSPTLVAVSCKAQAGRCGKERSENYASRQAPGVPCDALPTRRPPQNHISRHAPGASCDALPGGLAVEQGGSSGLCE